MIRRLKIKFVCINMLIVTVMLAAIFATVLYMTGSKAQEQGNHILQSIHEDALHKGPLPGDKRVPYFTVTVTPQGVFQISTHAYFDHIVDAELLELAQDVYEGAELKGFLKEYDLRFSRRNSPMGTEIVFLDVSMENSMLRDLMKTCIPISIVSYVLFFAVSILLAQWAICPVEVAWNQQRQFVADASHELKTPLTVIMTNAELLRENGYDEAVPMQFTDSILNMTCQMRGLVEGLLDLARVDNGVIKSAMTELSISEVVSNSILSFEVLLFEKGLELETDVDPDIHLKASGSHMQQVVEILLDNAGKYAAPGSTVEISLKRQGRTALLCVSTEGEEISREDLKNIFRRFYRMDRARTMNHSYGLGLSIAEGIVREHNGKIWAESRNGRNFFYVQLPAMQK